MPKEKRVTEAKKPGDGADDPLGRLSEVERPGELAAQLCEGPGRLRRVLDLGHLALEPCDACLYDLALRDELGFSLRLHDADYLPHVAQQTGPPIDAV